MYGLSATIAHAIAGIDHGVLRERLLRLVARKYDGKARVVGQPLEQGDGLIGQRHQVLALHLHALMLLSEGQMSDYKGAALMIDALPRATPLLGDKGYDADWFRAALANREITACIPSKTNRTVPIPHDAILYRQRHKIEIMLRRLKGWRRIHTRYARCAHTFFSAICIAATVIFWLSSMSHRVIAAAFLGPRLRRTLLVVDS